MVNFDKTYTDPEFQQEIRNADNEWMAALARPEPDLEVEGLRPNLLSRVLGIFGPRSR